MEIPYAAPERVINYMVFKHCDLFSCSLVVALSNYATLDTLLRSDLQNYWGFNFSFQ